MPNNYFVYGDEEYLIKAKLQELRKKYGEDDAWNVERLESWADLQDKLLTQSMFASSRLFICPYEVLERDKPGIPRLEEILSQHTNVLIIYANSRPDKRTQLYKTLSKACTLWEVQAPKGPELQRWLLTKVREDGGKIGHEAAGELIYLAGSDMLTLENEVAKLINYDPNITLANVRALAVRTMHSSIFDLVDAVVQERSSRAMIIAEELFRGGAAEPYLLHMLARQYRLLYRLLFHKTRGYGSSEIQKMMPMHPYAFQKLHAQAANITLHQCADSLHKIGEADYHFKTGRNQGLSLLQSLLAKLAKK